jgi:hypothetical protein
MQNNYSISHNLNLKNKMKKSYTLRLRALASWLAGGIIILGMTGNSNAQSCTVDAGSSTAVCAGSTTAALGGSFGGGATGATWSDGGAGGTFSNNDGSTPAAATYTPSASAFGNVSLTLTADGPCGATTAVKLLVVNKLHSEDLLEFYNYSCDRSTLGFSDVSQTFTAPFSGYISQVNAGIGLWMTPTSYNTVISTPSHTVDYGVLGYSGRCCYSMCATGNNMASTNLPVGFYVTAGEPVTISFSGYGGDLHFENGILRMYITGHPLVNGTSVTADGSTTFCDGGTVILDAGNFYSYAWSPSGNTQTISASATGSYSVTVSDENGCNASASEEVTVNPLPVIGVNVSPSATVSTGTSVTLSGTGAVSYSWTGGITDGVAFTATSTETYTVSGTDGKGCTGSAAQTVTVTQVQTDPLVINSTESAAAYSGYNVSCNGASNGTATVNASGGTAPLSYVWSNGQTTSTATGLAAGSYSVIVTDASGATAAASVTLTQPSALSVSAGSNEWTYFGYNADQTFSHTAVVSGGVGPYTYAWTMNRPLKCNTVNSAGDESFASGSCTFNSCPSLPLNMSLASPPSCSGNGTVTLKLIDTAQVIITVTDANGCIATNSFWVYAQDARCFAGNSGNMKIKICHRHNNSWVQLCVDSAALPAMLALGDYVGNCNNLREAGELMEGEASSLLTSYPNPFTSTTTIAFSVPADGRAMLRIFDGMGRQVSVLFDGIATAGTLNKVEFNGADYPSGIYFYSIVSDDLNETKRMELAK